MTRLLPLLAWSALAAALPATVLGGPGYRTGAGPGVRLDSGQVTIAGDASTQVKAVGLFAGFGSESAIVVNGGTLVLEPAVTLTPVAPSPPITNSGGTVVQKQVASFAADVTAQLLTVRLHAPGATLVALLGGPPLTPSVSLPFGELWIGPAHQVMNLGTIGPGGVRSAMVEIARVPVGAELAMQWVLLRGGGVELSTPVVRTMDS